jgi:nitrogen fixation/metabolism regulation signal transduction histidine kinase
MLYKKLFFQILFRIILILINALLLSYLFFLNKFIAAQINLFLLLLAQGFFLVYYLNKTNRDLSHFFTSVKNEDSTIVFKSDANTSYGSLYEKLNEVNSLIKKTRIEKIGQYEYLKQVVENVAIGILSFDEDLKVQFFNPAGKTILKVSKLSRLDDLEIIYPGLAQKLKNLTPDNQQLLNIEKGLELSVKLADFKISDKKIKLIAFQNIHSELDKREVDSWQKIIRVLTHEIMNSVSPISSATDAIYNLFLNEDKPLDAKEINEETIKKTIKGITIIQQRSKGMLEFVQKFRDLTLLPELNKENFQIQDLILTMETLFALEFKNGNINFESNIFPKNLSVFADKIQTEQVLINLIKNASQALINQEYPIIKINANVLNDHVQIMISDNGQGISTEVLDNIFIPFFTTKEKGSGIGLSLSRQIMLLHGGNISVKSEPEKETVFILTF